MKSFCLTMSGLGMLILALSFTACASAQPLPQTAVNQTFENQITLLGYTLNDSRDRVQLFWQAGKTPAVDYLMFAQIMDEQGRLVAQSDQTPGAVPTSQWTLGQIVINDYALAQPNLSPATYTLQVGLYHPATGKRLSIDGKSSASVTITKFEIKRK